MTPAEFNAWRDHMAVKLGKATPDARFTATLSDRETAAMLGASYMTVRAWSKDREAPPYVALACAALSAGIEPWSGTKPPKASRRA